MPFDFADTSVNNSDGGSDTPMSSDLACEVCGTPLTYAGRGRKPRFCDEHKRSQSASSARGSKDVEAACNALHTVYEGVLFPLSAIDTAMGSLWSAQIDGLDARNRAILTADPKLARRIVDAAAKGGGTALVFSHLLAIVPVAGYAYMGMRERAAQRRTAGGLAGPAPAEDMTDPDAAFAMHTVNGS